MRVGLLPVGCQCPAGTKPQQAIGAWAGMSGSHWVLSCVDHWLSSTARGCDWWAWRGSARPCVLSWEHQLLDGTRSFPGAATSGLVVCECVSMQGTLTMPWLPGSEVA